MRFSIQIADLYLQKNPRRIWRIHEFCATFACRIKRCDQFGEMKKLCHHIWGRWCFGTLGKYNGRIPAFSSVAYLYRRRKIS